MESVMVVCKVYKLFKDGKNFTKESKKVIRNRCVIPRWYALDKNAKWEQNGRWHEINEEATKEYYEVGRKLQEEKRKAKETKGKLAEILTNVIEEGAKPKKTKAIIIDDPSASKELLDLRVEYVKVVGKKLSGRFLNDVDWITKKINEVKSKSE
jgi:hypothetical protein